MRSRYQILFFVLTLALASIGLTASMEPSSSTSAQTTIPDDEIAYVRNDSKIVVIEPSNNSTFWTSPTTGWTNLATIDSNGDGVDELVAIGGDRVQLFNPYVPSGTPPEFSRTLGSGLSYNLIAIGDLVWGDGGLPEILVQRTDNRQGISYSIQIYDGDQNGRNWTQVYDRGFGVRWLSIKAGDVDGLEGDEIVMVRNGTNNTDKRMLIFTNNLDHTWIDLYEDTYGYPWLALDVGNTQTNNGAIDEILISRSGVLGVLPSFLTFQYRVGNLEDAPNGQGNYFPYWEDIASGDVNNSGDEEVFLVRDPQQNGGISLIGLNWGDDTLPAAWTDPGLVLGRDLKRVVMGDTDGDTKDEVVVTSDSEYRIYVEPGSNLNHNTVVPASFRVPVAIAVGNYDGSGVSTEPPSLRSRPTVLYFETDRGANPDEQTFEVLNDGGGGGIAYKATLQNNAGWVSVTPFEGTTPKTHTVTINSANLPPGWYTDVIRITAVTPGVENSPLDIPVQLSVKATGPLLLVDPTSKDLEMNFGGIPPEPFTVSIRNAGDGGRQFYQLNIATADGVDWLRTDKTSGFTDDQITVSVDAHNLPSGDYSGTISVNAGEIEDSPMDINVTLKIIPTGMEVTPTELLMQADINQASPTGEISIEQAASGSGAIHWYAYAVPAGDWDALQAAKHSGDLDIKTVGEQLVFIDSDGVEHAVGCCIPWVNLTPSDGITPNFMQVTLNMDLAPIGDNRVTILVDGGPETPNRFQGVDLRALISDGGAWLPMVLAE